MHLIMFDIDGTLVESYEFDSVCFALAVHDVLDIPVNPDWDKYTHVTDSGILQQLIDESVDLEPDDTQVDRVRQRFVYYLSEKLKSIELKQVPGAAQFLSLLSARDDVAVSLATGGWLESAQLKLAAAGIEVSNIPIASSSDHYKRVEIMKISEQRCGSGSFDSKTYFGDGLWDMQASQSLGYKFMLVGNRIDWRYSITDYRDSSAVLKQIGL